MAGHELARLLLSMLRSSRCWTLTAVFYPGARWAGSAAECPTGQVAMESITTTRKIGTARVLVGLLALAARRG